MNISPSILIFLVIMTFAYSNSNFKNVTELDFTSKSDMKKYMKEISKDIGVKCSFCHDLDDKSLETENKEIGREMIKLTRYLNDVLNTSNNPKNYKTYVTCWTCHHGNVEPEHKRPIE
tara:strand:+ start:1201 stop:1554 length:354 start_codon:yes stop_codon:yes gene_type:complete